MLTRVPPGQVLVLVEVLEERGLADELLLLAHLLTRAARFGQLDLQSAEGGPHDLAVTEVLTTQHRVTKQNHYHRNASLHRFQEVLTTSGFRAN